MFLTFRHKIYGLVCLISGLVSLILGTTLFIEHSPIGFNEVWQGLKTAVKIGGLPAAQLVCKSLTNHSQDQKETASSNFEAMEEQIAALRAELEQAKISLAELAQTKMTLQVDATKIMQAQLQTELEQATMTLQDGLEQAKMTLQAELEHAKMILQADSKKNLQAQVAHTKLTLQAELEQAKMTLQAELEQATVTLQAEFAQMKMTNRRQEAASAESVANGTPLTVNTNDKVLSHQKPTGVFTGDWGNVAAPSDFTTSVYRMTMDCSSFLYHDKTVVGSIKFTVTKTSFSDDRGRQWEERFSGIWNVTSQTIIGHGVSTSNWGMWKVAKNYVMKFTDNTVLVTRPEGASLLTKAVEK